MNNDYDIQALKQLVCKLEKLITTFEKSTFSVVELTSRIETLELIIINSGLMNEFIPLKLAATTLGISESRIRKTLRKARLNPRNSPIKGGIHYSFNGNRILINVVAWQRDINSIPPEQW